MAESIPHRSRNPEDRLTPIEAFKAMALFLDLHAGHEGDTAASLLAEVSLERDGAPTDPAIWLDWLACARRVLGEDASDSAVHLAEIAAFGPVAVQVAAFVASRPTDGVAAALAEGIPRIASSNTNALRIYLRALARVHGALPPEERQRLLSEAEASIVALTEELFPLSEPQ